MNRIRQYGLAATMVLIAAATASFGEQRSVGTQPPTAARQPAAAEPAPAPNSTVEGLESAQAVRTREFLGLGPMPDVKAASQGAPIFRSNCAFCHGAEARGGEGPDLLRSQVVLDDQKGELIAPVVHNGRTGMGMPAFPSLTDAQVYDVAEFLHLQIELAANRGAYKILNIVDGDGRAGKAYFNGEGKCTTCHSVTGDLAHIGSKLAPPELQQTFLYPGNRSDSPGDARYTRKVTVTLPDGKSLTGTVRYLDDFNVSLYDAAGNYHSIALGKEVKVHLEDRLAFHRQMLAKYTDLQIHDLTAYLVTLK